MAHITGSTDVICKKQILNNWYIDIHSGIWAAFNVSRKEQKGEKGGNL